MKHLFVPYELALKLKEKAYGEPCLAFYTKALNGVLCGNLWNGNPIEMGIPDNSKHIDCLAPLYQQVIDWFREKHNLAILIAIPFDVFWTYSINGINGNGYYTDSSYKEKKDFIEYYEALNTAIEEALKLI